ncbi:hypothetical protein STEG23_025089 [Scotinomys teguina]
MGIPKDGLQNLANTLEGDKDLNSPRELSAEAEKELAIVEKTIREAHVDRVNPELKCILVILPSRHSPTGILMQREDVILEWIFLPRKPNKKLKTYIEKISDLIHKATLVSTTMVCLSGPEGLPGASKLLGERSVQPLVDELCDLIEHTRPNEKNLCRMGLMAEEDSCCSDWCLQCYGDLAMYYSLSFMELEAA